MNAGPGSGAWVAASDRWNLSPRPGFLEALEQAATRAIDYSNQEEFRGDCEGKNRQNQRRNTRLFDMT
jgi:hypothetical protein